MELPAGFRFHPTDEELVIHYLCRKCAALPLSASFIADIDLYKFDPWLLPGMALYGEKEWYFFSPRDRKYPNGSRPNRAAGTGYWKATGADKPIGKPKALGIKKALVFYAGKSPKGVKTNWIMHEYRLANVDHSAIKKTDQRLDDWVLCRIYNKKGRIEKWDAGMEDRKAEAFPRGHNEVVKNEPLYFDTSDSVPRCQTETSGSGHVASPEFYNEVQSEPNWSELEKALDFHFNYEMDPFENGPLGLKVQYPQDPFEEMFMYCR